MSACFVAFLLAIGVTTLLRRDVVEIPGTMRREIGWPALVACGAAVGIGSGLTGVGGPAILVPLLLLLKFPASVAIGISQPNSIVASASGALGHLLFGRIDFVLAAFLSVAAGGGVALGAAIHRRVSGESLRKIVAAGCIVLSLWLGSQLLRHLPGI